MEQYSTITNCAVCGQENPRPILKARDHFLTHEAFQILQCDNCLLRITSPQPPPNEIFKYYDSDDYVSHNDSDRGLVNFAYQQVKKITLRNKLSLLREYTTGKRLLDFGSGTGDFLFHAQENGFHTVGLEPEESARKIATEKGLEIHHPLWLNDNTDSFDVITLWHVLEHTYDPVETLLDLKNNLAEEGFMFVAVPNYASFDAQKYNAFWAAYDLPRHLFHFHPDTMKTVQEKTGLTLVAQKGMIFDSFYVSMLSEKYRNGFMTSALWTGLKSNLKARKSGNFSSLIYIFRK